MRTDSLPRALTHAIAAAASLQILQDLGEAETARVAGALSLPDGPARDRARETTLRHLADCMDRIIPPEDGDAHDRTDPAVRRVLLSALLICKVEGLWITIPEYAPESTDWRAIYGHQKDGVQTLKMAR